MMLTYTPYFHIHTVFFLHTVFPTFSAGLGWKPGCVQSSLTCVCIFFFSVDIRGEEEIRHQTSEVCKRAGISLQRRAREEASDITGTQERRHQTSEGLQDLNSFFRTHTMVLHAGESRSRQAFKTGISIFNTRDRENLIWRRWRSPIQSHNAG